MDNDILNTVSVICKTDAPSNISYSSVVFDTNFSTTTICNCFLLIVTLCYKILPFFKICLIAGKAIQATHIYVGITFRRSYVWSPALSILYFPATLLLITAISYNLHAHTCNFTATSHLLCSFLLLLLLIFAHPTTFTVSYREREERESA